MDQNNRTPTCRCDSEYGDILVPYFEDGRGITLTCRIESDQGGWALSRCAVNRLVCRLCFG
eukprot:scaffold535_cov190-Isochrysis_galbana.AAC.1